MKTTLLLGESAKAVRFSVTEGEDKPLKYPHRDGVADAVVPSKLDLVSHLDIDLERGIKSERDVHPQAEILKARTGGGFPSLCGWIKQRRAKLT